jgi:hypothetical protein
MYKHRKLPENTPEDPDSEKDNNQSSDLDDDNTTNIDMDTFKPSVLLSSLLNTNERNNNDQTPQGIPTDISLQTCPDTTQLTPRQTPMKPRPAPKKRTATSTPRDDSVLNKRRKRGKDEVDTASTPRDDSVLTKRRKRGKDEVDSDEEDVPPNRQEWTRAQDEHIDCNKETMAINEACRLVDSLLNTNTSDNATTNSFGSSSSSSSSSSSHSTGSR